MEIPKDGKCYLAWHTNRGFCMVVWSNEFDLYWDSMDGLRFDDHITDGVLNRWMDEKGIWHEIKQEK